jgi:KDO2-lipid IV(A) lauroyltransferase
LKNKLEYFFFICFSKIFGLIGLSAARKFASLLTFITFYFIPIRKSTVIENLKLAFPNFTKKEIRRIAYGSYKSFAITLIEILYMPYLSREQLEEMIKCENIGLILQKKEMQKGVILLSGHFGNWEYNAASVSAQLKTSFSIVVKNQRNPFVSEWMNKMRTRWENKIVPLGVSIRQIFKELKEKNVVAMIADQRGPAEGIRVDFFGRKAAVYTGPAVLALKTGAPILIGISVRLPDYSYYTKIEEIRLDNLPEKEEDKIIEISQRHTTFLENVIRKHPEQWLWMHKRWKY